MRCWGEGLATGALAGARYPREVALAVDAQAVFAGGAHSCAIDVNDDVWCWGAGGSGQLGDGGATARTAPVAVDLPPVASLALAGESSCALLRDGRVRCWGLNDRGQLGDGTTDDRASPVAVTTSTGVELDGVVEIATGRSSTCVRRDDGGVHCWGDNRAGALGEPDPARIRLRPDLEVSVVAGATALAGAGENHVVTLMDGSLRTWGSTAVLGVWRPDGATVLTPRGFAAVDGRVVRTLSAGPRHQCAGVESGGLVELWCWGEFTGAIFGAADYERRHEGAPDERAQWPTALVAPSFATLASGRDATCLVMAGGAVACVGKPESPILAADGWDEENDTTFAPRYLGGRTLEGARSTGELAELRLQSGVEHTCLRRAEEELVCWGGSPEAYTGAHGTGLEIPMTVATPTVNDRNDEDRMSVPAIGELATVAAGSFAMCMLDTENKPRCAGFGYGAFPENYNLGDDVGVLRGARAIAVGGDHFCTLSRLGESDLLRCVDTTRSDAIWAPDLVSFGPIRDLALGTRHSCVLAVDGSVSCVGENESGQLGQPGPASAEPVVAWPAGALALSARDVSTCAVIGEGETGHLECRGGLAAANEDFVASFGEDVAKVVLAHGPVDEPGELAGCVRTGTEFAGTLRCWGVLGGTPAAPAEIASWTEREFQVADFSVSQQHVCWLGYGGIRCRGDSRDGRLGGYDLYGPRVIRAE